MGVSPNGFQDFLRNPTLTQNNRKYQTIENAENPVKSRAFGVLSFQKSKTVDGARISASKTISKDFLEKVLEGIIFCFVPMAKTSSVSRDFGALQKFATANFQDRLVVTASIFLLIIMHAVAL